LPADLDLGEDVVGFWGTSTREGDMVSSPGGRVLTVTARGFTVPDARANAYAAIARLKARVPSGTPLSFRTDIAAGL
jgi:phosphoribosylamine-glycine ligase